MIQLPNAYACAPHSGTIWYNSHRSITQLPTSPITEPHSRLSAAPSHLVKRCLRNGPKFLCGCQLKEDRMYQTCAISKAVQFCSEQFEMSKWIISGDVTSETVDSQAPTLGITRARWIRNVNGFLNVYFNVTLLNIQIALFPGDVNQNTSRFFYGYTSCMLRTNFTSFFLMTPLLTYSMEQSPSWEANWFCN